MNLLAALTTFDEGGPSDGDKKMTTTIKAVMVSLLIAQCIGCKSGSTTDEEWKAEKMAEWRAAVDAEIGKRLDVRQGYVQQNPAISPNVAKAITGGGLVRGMTEEQVFLTWGGADKINTSTGAWGRRDQWVYEFEDTSHSVRKGIVDPNWFPGRYFLYFSNGFLDSWQSFR